VVVSFVMYVEDAMVTQKHVGPLTSCLVCLACSAAIAAADGPPTASRYHLGVPSAADEAFIFAITTPDWNLLSDEFAATEPQMRSGTALAGWRFFDEAPVAGSAADDFLYRVSADLQDVSRRLGDGQDATYARGALADGRATYAFFDVKSRERELYMGRLDRRVEENTSLSARLLVNAEHPAASAALPLLDSRLVPANAARVGVETMVGRFRVWGEFQINDWNGITDQNVQRTPVAAPSVAVAAAALTDSNAVASPPAVLGDPQDTVSFEVGAAFPTDKGLGAVHYRRSTDDTSSVVAVERQQVGLRGEVAIKDDVRFKAGYDRIHSSSGAYQQLESNIWTGIEINF